MVQKSHQSTPYGSRAFQWYKSPIKAHPTDQGLFKGTKIPLVHTPTRLRAFQWYKNPIKAPPTDRGLFNGYENPLGAHPYSVESFSMVC
jgi:hypothetical protein